MKISVVIACYNSEKTVAVQMEALTKQSWVDEWEVIVADNRCTDNSIPVIKNFKDKLPQLKIIQAYEKQGQAYALNTAVQNSSGDAVVFCDADDMVASNYLNSIGNALRKNRFVACGMDVKFLNKCHPENDGKGNPQEKGLQKIWYPPYLSHAGSGTIGVETLLHRSVGGFDESLRYLFDTDYCFKIQILTGEKLFFVTDTVMHIRNRSNLINNYRQSRNYAEYNVALFKKYRFTAEEKPHLWKQYLKESKELLVFASKAYKEESRYRFVWDVGRQVGRLKGSIRYRVPPV